MRTKPIPEDAISIVLYRICGERLFGCETVSFPNGNAGISTVLCRAAISGKVEVGGKLVKHFADLCNAAGDIIESVALDAKSYGALKNQWMRCKVVTES